LIIDVHAHIAKSGTTHPEMVGGTLEDLFKYMQLRGISRCVILPTAEMVLPTMGDVEHKQYAYSTEEAIEISRKYPEKIIPFANVDWRWGPQAVKKLKKYVEMGCRGCGELNHQLVVDDVRLMPIYRICGELRIPVLLHIGGYPFNPDLDGFMRVLIEFRNTNFIAHAPGWWTHISAEVPPYETYPWGLVKPGGKADMILQRFPNAYADISASSGLTALQRDFRFAHEFLERNKDKLMYGTDFPCKDWINKERFGVDGLHLNFLKALGLSQETFEKVTYKNAEKLLKIE